MFLGINMFLALLKLILTLATLGLKWVWVGPKTYLCPRISTLLLYCLAINNAAYTKIKKLTVLNILEGKLGGGGAEKPPWYWQLWVNFGNVFLA